MVSLIKYKDSPLKNKPPTARTPIPLSVVPPQEALVPVWNSPFYLTPDEPADPRDCDRYPDSPWCGGFPWRWTPVAIEPSIVLDECNVGIELKPVLGWTVLPPVQIVYRKQTPECKLKKVPPPLPSFDDSEFIPIDVPTRRGCLYKVDIAYSYWEVNYNSLHPYIPPSSAVYRQYPTGNNTVQTLHVWGEIAGFLIQSRTRTTIRTNNQGGNPIPVTLNTSMAFLVAKIDGDSYTNVAEDEFIFLDTFQGQEYVKRVSKLSESLPASFWEYCVGGSGGWGSVTNDVKYAPNSPSWQILKITEIWCATEIALLPPPPPLLPKKCDCTMTCCPSTEQNDQLLKLLIKKVDKLSSIVGVDDYPVSLPTSLISKDEGFFGNLIPNQNMDVPSLTRLAAWYIERFDEIMGQWEIPIEIKDSDPSKPGDQPLGVKLPNMAEAIAEMFTLAFQTNLNSETLLNFAVRTAAETVADKQQNFLTYNLLQSITEWAGYKQKDIRLKMPILFSLGKTRYDEVLKESEVDVLCVEFDEKFGLEADLMRFREAVSILQANYKRKVDPSGDVKAQILKHLLDTFATVKKINGEDDDKDFTQFLTDVENGFINEPGVSNPTNPYGRPYTERPRIRDLTKFEPPTEP